MIRILDKKGNIHGFSRVYYTVFPLYDGFIVEYKGLNGDIHFFIEGVLLEDGEASIVSI